MSLWALIERGMVVVVFACCVVVGGMWFAVPHLRARLGDTLVRVFAWPEPVSHRAVVRMPVRFPEFFFRCLATLVITLAVVFGFAYVIAAGSVGVELVQYMVGSVPGVVWALLGVCPLGLVAGFAVTAFVFIVVLSVRAAVLTAYDYPVASVVWLTGAGALVFLVAN